MQRLICNKQSLNIDPESFPYTKVKKKNYKQIRPYFLTLAKFGENKPKQNSLKSLKSRSM